MITRADIPNSTKDNPDIFLQSHNPWLKPQQESVLMLSRERDDVSEEKELEADLDESGFDKDDVAAAFAYDDITLDFMDEKEEREKEDLEESNELPGWGKWANKDGNIENKKSKKNEKKKKTKKPKPKSNLPFVIVNEECKDELRKHQVLKVPFPFHNQSHFETTLHNPTGREWNTESRFTEKTRPRVYVPTGKIIPPAGARNNPYKERNNNNN